MQLDPVRRVLAALEAHGVEYVVFGGVAVNLHGLVRATEDLDLFVRPDPGNIARLKSALLDVFADESICEIEAAELMGDYPAVQYVPPEGDFHLDILTRLGEAFSFDDLDSMRVRLADLEVTVATPACLFRMKKDTVRARDRNDAAALRERFGLEED